MKRPKVVIVGGGFGGLNAAKGLRGAALDVLVIDKTNHHLFQPLLYQVATAALSPGEIAAPIREILRGQENTSVIMGEVLSINKENKTLTLKDGETISYDFLILAVGARHSYFGNDSWENSAPGLKTVADALSIREHILLSFEKAERLEGSGNTEKFLNFVVVGGGPTGVEMAGAIAEVAHTTLFKNFRRIKPETAKIYLVEAAPHILPSYPEHLSIRAEKDLENLGVKVLIRTKVTRISEDGVETDGGFIPSANIIWAAGNQASPLLKTLNVPLDRQGRAIVEKDLSIPGHPEVFVIGDAACAMDKNGKPIIGTAPPAIQEGNYVAKLLCKGLPVEKRPPFRYFDKGYMATIGKGKGIAVVGKWHMTGFLAWSAWCFIHILYLIGFRNRVTVMMEWVAIFFSGQRGVRLINRPIDMPP